MVYLERILANIRAVDYIVKNDIPGDFVECGVWRGGSAMAMVLAVKGHAPRTLWMYDTYSGLTDATSEHKPFRRRRVGVDDGGKAIGSPRAQPKTVPGFA